MYTPTVEIVKKYYKKDLISRQHVMMKHLNIFKTWKATSEVTFGIKDYIFFKLQIPETMVKFLLKTHTHLHRYKICFVNFKRIYSARVFVYFLGLLLKFMETYN